MAESPSRDAPVAGPSLAPFAALSFAYFASIGLFNTYAPLWFKEMGLSALVIGAIGSLQAWTRLVAPYAWGWLADHRGQRERLLRTAALASVVVACALPWHPPLWVLLAVVALLFLANGGIVPLSEASLAAHLHTAQGLDAGRYGRIRVWGSIGFIVAVTGFGFALERTGVAAFPWLVVLMFAGLAVAAWQVPPGVPHAPEAAQAAPGAWSVVRQPAVAWFFASVFFTVLGHTALYLFFSLYLDAQGHGKSVVGLMWAVGVSVEIVFFWMQGRWAHRLSPEAWLGLAGALAALRFAAVALFGGTLWLLVATQLTHAVTFAAHHAACTQLVHRHFPGALRSRGQALYTMLGYGLSGVLGGVAFGALVEGLGYASVFWVASFSAALGAACAWACARAGTASEER